VKIYVGNLSYKLTSEELEALFAEYGTVASATIINDRETGRPKGFGFVEFSDDTEGKAAIEGLNGKEVQGRPLVVNEARPQTDRRPGGNGGGYNRDNRGGGNGGGSGHRNTFRRSY
jgi:cold-inducible RNA-binding protein